MMCNAVAVVNILISVLILVSFIKRVHSELDLTHAKTVKIVHPRIVEEAIRKRRSIHDNLYYEEDDYLKIIEIGDWAVRLNPNSESWLIVPRDLKTEWIGSDGATKLRDLRRCDYRTGVILGLETVSTGAVTVCGTSVMAYFDVGGEAYFVQPLNESGAHVLYNSNGPSRLKRSQFAGDVYSQKATTTPQWMFNLTGDIIDIEGNGEVEFESGSDDDISSGNGAGHDITVTGGNSSTQIPIPLTQREWHREQLAYEEDGYFYDTAWTTNIVQARKQGSSILPSRWLEMAIAVDHTLISFHGRSKVEQYVLSLMNIVSAIYQDPSLEGNMKIVITRLLLYEHKKHGVVRPGNAKKSLENVNAWNRRLHASLAPGEPHHDLAVWLTRSDIGGPSGYAPVGGVCDPKRSCALNRDEGLTSAFIIAHETAHILGLSHDGDMKNGNDCGDEAQEGSVMAPMVAATFSKFSWSECSKREFRKNMNKWTCLLNIPDSVGHIALNATLQTSFTMDEQCRMEFGNGYATCRAFEIIEPCSHLWCGHEKSPLVCKTKKGPPLEGTECGFSKWCVNGYCEEVGNRRSERVPVVLNPQDGGWSDWSPWGICSRTCGMGVQFKSRKCNSPPPSYGGKHCDGEPEEWRLCNNNACPEPLMDLRAQQCKHLPKLLHMEKNPEANFTWLPYESDDKEKKCKFLCISAERKDVFTSEENLMDGTPCSYENPDNICIQGKCQIVGCDGNLGSKIKRDNCGVCDGNNTDCSEIRFSHNRKLRKEVSRVSILPRMAREIKVEINVTEHHSGTPTVAFILKNRKNRKYTVTIPNTVIHTKIIEGTKFSYKKISNKHYMWARGPLSEEMVILVVVPKREIELGVDISYNTLYYIHKHFLEPSKRFTWIMGGWGPCSASCGGGRRQKTTACWDNKNNTVVRRVYCSLLLKPKLETEKCNTFGCNLQWISGEWEACTASCGHYGIQSRELYCVPSSVLNEMLFKHNGTMTKHPWVYMVNPSKCSGMKPSSERPCNRIPCPTYWTFGEWSQCSASCGSGVQSRTFECVPPGEETYYSCGIQPRPQKRLCIGNHTRYTNPLCHGRKKKTCLEDASEYCAFTLLHKYCKISGFRRHCCKSCLSYSDINTRYEYVHDIKHNKI